MAQNHPIRELAKADLPDVRERGGDDVLCDRIVFDDYTVLAFVGGFRVSFNWHRVGSVPTALTVASRDDVHTAWCGSET